MGGSKLKELFKETFNMVADGYDGAAMRFFPQRAGRLPAFLNLNGDEQVLDVACGTGCASFALAKNLPEGHVTGIDFSRGMLSRAMRKQEAAGIHNVTFAEMDMQAIDFPEAYFDLAVSAFSIFFVDDMRSQLMHIVWNGGFRGLINKLAPAELKAFKEKHLSEIEQLASDRGIWLEMSILYTLGSTR
jgi:ubiquinone/menaquinone biosynthesis C-methylase UbiE